MDPYMSQPPPISFAGSQDYFGQGFDIFPPSDAFSSLVQSPGFITVPIFDPEEAPLGVSETDHGEFSSGQLEAISDEKEDKQTGDVADSTGHGDDSERSGRSSVSQQEKLSVLPLEDEEGSEFVVHSAKVNPSSQLTVEGKELFEQVQAHPAKRCDIIFKNLIAERLPSQWVPPSSDSFRKKGQKRRFDEIEDRTILYFLYNAYYLQKGLTWQSKIDWDRIVTYIHLEPGRGKQRITEYFRKTLLFSAVYKALEKNEKAYLDKLIRDQKGASARVINWDPILSKMEQEFKRIFTLHQLHNHHHNGLQKKRTRVKARMDEKSEKGQKGGLKRKFGQSLHEAEQASKKPRVE